MRGMTACTVRSRLSPEYDQKLMQVQRQQGERPGLGAILPTVTKGVTQ